jgi:hypothetical protein
MSDKIRASFSLPSLQAVNYLTEADMLLAKDPKDLKAMASLSVKIGLIINILNKSLNDWSEFFFKLVKENLEIETLIFENFRSNGHHPTNLVACLRDKMLKLDLVVRPPEGRRTKLYEALNIKKEFSDESFANEQIWKPKTRYYQSIYKISNKISIMDFNNDKMEFPISNRDKEFPPYLFPCGREEKPLENKNILEADEMILEKIPDAKQMILEEKIPKIEENNSDLDDKLEMNNKISKEDENKILEEGGNEILPPANSIVDMSAPLSPSSLISPLTPIAQSINKDYNVGRINRTEILGEQITSPIFELQNNLTSIKSLKLSKFISFLLKIYSFNNFGSTYAASHILFSESLKLNWRKILSIIISLFDLRRSHHNHNQIICQKLLGIKRSLDALYKDYIKGWCELAVQFKERSIKMRCLSYFVDKATLFWWPDIPPWPPPKFSEESIFCGKFLSRIYILIGFRSNSNIRQTHNIQSAF